MEKLRQRCVRYFPSLFAYGRSSRDAGSLSLAPQVVAMSHAIEPAYIRGLPHVMCVGKEVSIRRKTYIGVGVLCTAGTLLSNFRAPCSRLLYAYW